MIFLIVGLILSFGGILKDFLEKKADISTSNVAHKKTFLYWGTVLTIVGAVSTFLGGYSAEVEKDKAQRQQTLSEKAHDSAYKHLQDSLNHNLVTQLNSNSDSLFDVYIKALANYHLQYVNGQVSLKSYIKDSVEGDHPSLLINTQASNHYITPNKDSIVLYLPFQNMGNCAIKFSATIFIGDIHKSKYTFIGKHVAFINAQLPQNSEVRHCACLYHSGDFADKMIYYIKGHYSNMSGSKNMPIEQVITWDMKSPNDIGDPNPWQEDTIRRFFRHY